MSAPDAPEIGIRKDLVEASTVARCARDSGFSFFWDKEVSLKHTTLGLESSLLSLNIVVASNVLALVL